MKSGEKKFGRRLLLFLLLAAIVAALVMALGPQRGDSIPERSASVQEGIESVVRHLLTEYRIDPKEIRTRRIGVGNGDFRRIERRVSVVPEFNTLRFNHDLSRALAKHGATVIATEKLEDNSVAMHIKKDGVIVESIIFWMNKKR